MLSAPTCKVSSWRHVQFQDERASPPCPFLAAVAEEQSAQQAGRVGELQEQLQRLEEAVKDLKPQLGRTEASAKDLKQQVEILAANYKEIAEVLRVV